jgi:tight adherence protein C
MILLVIIGVGLVGLATGIFASVILWPQLRERSAGLLKRVDQYGFEGHERNEEGEGGVREKLDDLATKLGGYAAGGSTKSSASQERIRKQLTAAGLYNMTPGRFIGYRILASVGVPIVWIWLGVSIGANPTAIVLLTLVLASLGWVMPGRILRERAAQRLNELDYQLPELIDLLIVTVEAGLGFVGSLQTAAGRISDPLGQEIRLTLQEQSMGLSIQEALLHMLDRCETASMRSFVRSVVQGERLGVSIGQIMRDLAQEMRRRRRAVAQERAQKAPIKILFPLVLLIFPAMFIVLLGPALFLMFKAFSGG